MMKTYLCDKCAPIKILKERESKYVSFFVRDKKANLSYVIFYELFVTYFPTADLFWKRGSPFYHMSSVIINKFAIASFNELLNLKPTVELFILISLIQT
jgi:hypothetical protein